MNDMASTAATRWTPTIGFAQCRVRAVFFRLPLGGSMARLTPPARSTLPSDLQSIFDSAESYMGFVSNDALTMALKPALLKSALPFMRSIYSDGEVSFELKRLVGMMSSWASGCQYCVAHTAHGAHLLGVNVEKIQALPLFETSEHYTPAERAALQVARGAGQVPNAVTDDEFRELRRWFNDEQVVEIVAVISLFGFLNRWNATFATELEQSPLQFSERNLAAAGWVPGVHE
jgi:uncharacterized peroxidase-related enzyme